VFPHIKELAKTGFEHGLSEAFASFISYAHKAVPKGFQSTTCGLCKINN
jgi:hypothetical protein